MAIAARTPTSGTAASGAGFNITLPSSTVAGDMLVVVVGNAGTASPNAPTGWLRTYQGSAGTNQGVAVFTAQYRAGLTLSFTNVASVAAWKCNAYFETGSTIWLDGNGVGAHNTSNNTTMATGAPVATGGVAGDYEVLAYCWTSAATITFASGSTQEGTPQANSTSVSVTLGHANATLGANGTATAYAPTLSASNSRKTGVGLLLMAVPTPTTAIGIQDSFDDGVIDTGLWFPFTQGTSTVTETSTLNITPDGVSGNYSGVVSNATYDLTGKYVMCQFVQRLNGVTGVVQSLQMQIDGSNNFEFKDADVNQMQAAFTLGGSQTNLGSVAWPGGVTWLRIHEANGVLYWMYSTDAISWTFYTRRTNPMAVTALKVNFISGCYQAVASPGTAQYENLNFVTIPHYIGSVSAAGVATVSGTIQRLRRLTGTSAGTSTVSATINKGTALTGTAAGGSTVSGTIQAVRYKNLAGQSNGVAKTSQDTYRRVILADTPVAWYRMDEQPPLHFQADIFINDSGPNNRWQYWNKGDPSSGSNETFGLSPGALAEGDSFVRLNGLAGSYANLPYQPELGGSGPFSVEGWIRVPSWASVDSPIFAMGDSLAVDRYLHCTVRNGLPYFGFYNDDYAPTGTTLSVNVWHHIVYVWEGPGTRVQRIYVDGVEWGTGRVSTGNLNVTSGGGVGTWVGRQTSYNLNGDLDEVALYGKALTAQQVLTHYNTAFNTPTKLNVKRQLLRTYGTVGSPGYGGRADGRAGVSGISWSTIVMQDSPALWWRLNETSGTIAYDSSGNNRNGTLNTGVSFPAASVMPNSSDGGAAFPGQDVAYIQGPMLPLFSGGVSFTIEMWVSSNVNYYPGREMLLFSCGDALAADQYVHTKINTGIPQIDFYNDNTTTGQPIPWPGFRHVVFTYDATTRRQGIYIDTVQFDNRVATAHPNVVNGSLTGNGFRIAAGGRVGGGSAWNGRIDEIVIYPSALSAARVAVHYNAGWGADPSIGISRRRGILNALSAGVATVSGTIAKRPSLFGRADGVAITTAALVPTSGPKDLTALAVGSATASAQIIARRAIVGSSIGVATASAQVVRRRAIVGSSIGVSTAAGTLKARRSMLGISTGVAVASGIMGKKGSVGGFSNGVSTASGQITRRRSLVVLSAGAATDSGSITALRRLAGTTAGKATTVATANAMRRLTGLAGGVATTSAVATRRRSVSGLGSGVAVATATMGVRYALRGQSNGVATTIRATINAAKSITGTSDGKATTTGVISTKQRNISGRADGKASPNGVVSIAPMLRGTSRGTAFLSSTISVSHVRYMWGHADGQGTASGLLEKIKAPVPTIGPPNNPAQDEAILTPTLVMTPFAVKPGSGIVVLITGVQNPEEVTVTDNVDPGYFNTAVPVTLNDNYWVAIYYLPSSVGGMVTCSVRTQNTIYRTRAVAFECTVVDKFDFFTGASAGSGDNTESPTTGAIMTGQSSYFGFAVIAGDDIAANKDPMWELAASGPSNVMNTMEEVTPNWFLESEWDDSTSVWSAAVAVFNRYGTSPNAIALIPPDRQLVLNESLDFDVARPNLLQNGGFELWAQEDPAYVYSGSGTETAKGWSIISDNGTIVAETVDVAPRASSRSMIMEPSDTDPFIVGQVIRADQVALHGCVISFSCMVKGLSGTMQFAPIITDNLTGFSLTAPLQVTNQWQTVRMTGTIDGVVDTSVTIQLCAVGDGTIVIDNANLVVGYIAADYSPTVVGGRDDELRKYVQNVMAKLDPEGPPPP